MATNTFASPPCAGTNVPFQSTIVPAWMMDGKTGKSSDEVLHCHHISVQAGYQSFSPEELRWADYLLEEDRRKAREKEIWSYRDPHPVEETQSSPLRPRVRLPPVTADTIIADLVKKLQDELKRKDLELRELKNGLETKMNELKRQKNELEDKKKDLDEQMAATLLQLSQKTKELLDKKLAESKEHVKANFWGSMTVDDALDLINGLSLSKEQASKFVQTNASIAAPVKEEVDVKVGIRLSNETPDDQIRDFLATNQLARNILVLNIKKKMEIEIEKVTAQYSELLKEENDAIAVERLVGTALDLSEWQLRDLLSSRKTVSEIILDNLEAYVNYRTTELRVEHLTSMKAAADRAEVAKAGAVYLAEKESTLRILRAEKRASNVMGKLGALEKAAQNTPDMHVKVLWQKIRSDHAVQVSQSSSEDLGCRSHSRALQEEHITQTYSSSSTLPNPSLKRWGAGRSPLSESTPLASNSLANTGGLKRERENDIEEWKHCKKARVEDDRSRRHGAKIKSEPLDDV